MFSAIKPFFELCRISNLPTVWTNVLAGVILTGIEFSWSNFLFLALSLSFFYSAGMCLNDMYDADSDKQKKADRPIPSGKVSIKDAGIFTISLFVTALGLLFFVPHQKAVYGGLFLILIIVIYDKFHKAHPLSVVLIAACRLMIFVITSVAVTGSLNSLVAVAGAIQFTYIVIISLVARYENRRKELFLFPVIPVMIASISLIDGLMLAVFSTPVLVTAGIGGTVLTLLGQRFVRGD